MTGSLLSFVFEAAVYGAASVLLMSFAWAVTRLLKSSSAALRHFVWLSSFVTLLAFPAVRVAIPHSRIFVAYSSTVAAPTAEPNPSDARRQLPDDQLAIQTAESPAPGAMTAKTLSRPMSTQHDPQNRWPEAFALVWGVGASLCLLHIFLAMIRIRNLRTRTATEHFATSAAYWVDRIGVRLGWRLRINEERAPPVAMTWGALKPTVLLPDTSVSWSEQRLEAVMLHELAHVRRRDCASQLLTAAVCALYWFNPLVWLGARAMRAEAESAADDLVLRSGVKPSAYAGELLRLAAELGRKKQPFGVAGVSIMKHSKIESRVVAILDSSRRRRGAGQLEAIAILAVAMTLCIPVARVKPAIEPDLHAGIVGPIQDLVDSNEFVANQNDLAMATATDDQGQSNLSLTPALKPQVKRTNAKAVKHAKPAPARSMALLKEANRRLTIRLQQQVAAYKLLQLRTAMESDRAKLRQQQAVAIEMDGRKSSQVKAITVNDVGNQRQILIDGVRVSSDKLATTIDRQAKIVKFKGPDGENVLRILDSNPSDAITAKAITVMPDVRVVAVGSTAHVVVDGQVREFALKDAHENMKIQTPVAITLENIQKTHSTLDALNLQDSKVKNNLARLREQIDASHKESADEMKMRSRLSELVAQQNSKDAGYQLRRARVNLELAMEALKLQSAKLKSDKNQQARLQRAREALEKAQRELEKSHE